MGRKNKDPNWIPRPPNSFIQFRCDKIKEMGESNEKPQPNLARKISDMWHAASPQEKALYIAKAKEAAELHKKKYPHYQYRPQKKKGKKTATAKAKVPDSPSSSTSYSSSTGSSASSPTPTTPDTAVLPMLAGGSSSSGGALGSNFGQDFVFNHNQAVPSGIHAIEQQSPSVQYDGVLRPPQIAGWTDQPQLASTSTGGMHLENNTSSLPPKRAGTTQASLVNPYCQPQAAYAPQRQAFNVSPGPTTEEATQLLIGLMNQQAPQPAPQQTSNQVLPLPQAHAAAPQPKTAPLSSEARSAELEAWNKEFAPLDAGFCDLLAAWTNLGTSAPAAASRSPAPSLSVGVTSASSSIPPTVAPNLSDAGDHARTLPSQSQDPLALLFDPAFFDPSLMAMFGAPGQQYNELDDPLQALPPSAVWPEALNPFNI